MNGAQVWGYPSDLPAAWDPCSSGTTRVKASGGTIALPDFGAFMLYLSETCTARAVFTAKLPDETDSEYQARMQDAYVSRALATFAATESYGVEREFVGGHALPGNPYLGDANVTLLAAGVAQSPRIGLSRLANALGATGREGLIHATPATVVAWGLFRSYRENDALFTVEGTPIAEGTGYIGAAPVPHGPPADGQDWAWVTGPVDIRRSQAIIYPGTVAEALDRSTNTITYRVERAYLATWDGVLQSAALIDWTITTT